MEIPFPHQYISRPLEFQTVLALSIHIISRFMLRCNEVADLSWRFWYLLKKVEEWPSPGNKGCALRSSELHLDYKGSSCAATCPHLLGSR